MHAALKRVVQNINVARLDLAGEGLLDRGHRGRHRAETARQGQPLRRQLPRAVEHRGRIVHVVLQHAGIGRAEDRQRHLVGDREKRILEQLEFDRIADHPGHAPLSVTSAASCLTAPTRKTRSSNAITHPSTRVPESASRACFGASESGPIDKARRLPLVSLEGNIRQGNRTGALVRIDPCWRNTVGLLHNNAHPSAFLFT